MLNTPAGTPADSNTSVQIWAENGESSDGLRTIVQPVASAGATLAAIWLIGQFHGVISAQTPIGSRTIRVLPRCSSNANSLRMLSATFRWMCPIRA